MSTYLLTSDGIPNPNQIDCVDCLIMCHVINYEDFLLLLSPWCLPHAPNETLNVWFIFPALPPIVKINLMRLPLEYN